MIEASFFEANRKRLAEQCSGVIVMTAHQEMQLVNDMAAPFIQESNFWYLTGIEDPDWQLIMTPQKSWLVSPDISETQRIFDGGLSKKRALEISGVDDVIHQATFKGLIHDLVNDYKVVYGLDRHPHQPYYSFAVNPAPAKLWRQLKRQFKEVQDVRQQINRLRAIKQPIEIAAIQKSVDLTIEAFNSVKAKLPTLTYENQAEAEFTYMFRYNNASHAYDPIVAGGINACTLHYTANCDAFKPSSMVLLDIGARIGGYSADISRTYSVDGTLSQRQREVHRAVQGVHEQIMDILTPNLDLAEYQRTVDDTMKQAIRSLGLLHSDKDYRRYFPHAISHGLGVDVHDTLGGFKELHSGMVITIEPGIYIPEEEIGIRLEDNILITDKGCLNLSRALSLDV